MKVLLANINSLWGVIINPQSSNTYRNIISFDSLDKKYEFINDNLFEGKDFRQLISNQKEIAPTNKKIVSSTKLIFRLNPKDYQEHNENINETISRMLNKDFAVVEYAKDKYKYYTLVSTRNGQLIEYTADLDIFFTYDVKDMFNDKETNIKRAMLNRYIKNGNVFKPNINDDKSEILNNEDFDIRDIELTPISYPKYEYYDYANLFNNNASDDEEKQAINDLMNEMLFEVIYTQIDNKSGFSKVLKHARGVDPFVYYDKFSKNRINFYNPVSLLIAQRTGEDNEKTNVVRITNKDGDEIDQYGVAMLASPSVLKNSRTIHMFNIFNDKRFVNIVSLNISKTIYNKWKLIIKIDLTGHEKPENWLDYGIDIKETNYTHYVEQDRYIRLSYRDIDNCFENEIKDITIFPKKIIELNNLDINNKKDLELEIKSHFYPYRKIDVNGVSPNQKMELKPQLFKLNSGYKIKYVADFSYTIANWGFIFKPSEYNVFNVNNNNNYRFDNYLESYGNYSLPTDIDAYEEFMIRTQSQQNAGIITSVAGAAVGIAGGIATGGLGLLAGLSIAGKSASSLMELFSKRQDQKNTPNELIGIGNTTITTQSIKGMRISFTEKQLPHYLLKLLQNHFYKYGYNINSDLKSINQYLKSRYYFNYIEVEESFENIKLQASADIKQIINDTLENGLTIWNYRDKSTWKGIKNYEYENVEMDIYNAK